MRFGVVNGGGGRNFALIDDEAAYVGSPPLPASIDEALSMGSDELRNQLESVDRGTLTRIERKGGGRLRAPIGREQEVWASGVTYERSREARVEESAEPSVYDLAYEAARPELFLKAVAPRVVGPNEPVGIRADSAWNVPEPELVLVVNAHGQIAGYTLGNDMSSRSIEGENPLYLPQAKIYNRACAIGPVIVPAWELPRPADLTIRLKVVRRRAEAFAAEISVGAMRRPFGELVEYLFRSLTFPYGAMLLTGTGIVPGEGFTLLEGDEVQIRADPIGTLTNTVIVV